MHPTVGETDFIYDPSAYESGAPMSRFSALRGSADILWVEEKKLKHWPKGEGFWVILSHKLCTEVLKNTSVFSSNIQGTQLRNPATKEDLDYVKEMMLNMDPPDHSRLRRHLIGAFTSKAIRELEEKISQHAEAIIDQVIECFPDGRCDFVSDIASDLPLRCLADIFGMPNEDRYLMYDWANRVVGFQDPDYAKSSLFNVESGSTMAFEAIKHRPKPDENGKMPDPRSRHGMNDLYAYAHLLAKHRRENPSDDVISILLRQLDDHGQPLTIAEFENMFWLFMVAGNETLRNGIPGGMIALLDQPESWEKLYLYPELMPKAVGEMLRWWSPVMNFRRTATSDIDLGGQRISAGDKVMVSFISANHDEKVFSSAARFDVERASNKHLSFGYGPHFCLGAQLAEAQMRAMFSQLVKRFRRIEIAAPPTFLRSNFQRGVKALPIKFFLR